MPAFYRECGGIRGDAVRWIAARTVYRKGTGSGDSGRGAVANNLRRLRRFYPVGLNRLRAMTNKMQREGRVDGGHGYLIYTKHQGNEVHV